jgi:hypothetical protein
MRKQKSVSRVKLQEERNALMKALENEKLLPEFDQAALYQGGTKLSPQVHAARGPVANRPKPKPQRAAARTHARG